jgi:tetratricopeptide (TPR) repeat protein
MAEGYGNLGVVYAELKQPHRAIEHYRHAVELKPNYPQVWYLMAYPQTMLGKYENARDSCLQAIRLKPDYAEAYHGLGVIYLKLHKKEAAIEQYRKLKSLNSDLADGLFGLIHSDKILTVRN